MGDITITDNRAAYQKRLDEYTKEVRDYFPKGWKGDFRKLRIEFNYLCMTCSPDDISFAWGFACGKFKEKTKHLN